MSAARRYLALRFIVVFLAALSLIDLVIMLGLTGWHAYSPAAVSTLVLHPMTYILAGASSAAVVLALLYATLLYPAQRKTILLLAVIVLALLGAHLYTINTPDTPNCNDTTKGVQGCIMDEVYYVPAAQALLAGEKCAPYQDNCNLEHPFLSKAFIAAGIAIFGNDTFGWRIFEVLLGTSSVPLLFGICWTITKNARLSLYAAFLLAFETLFFVHSSIAVIDVSAIFFSLLGFFFYFAKPRWWKVGPTALTAIAFGLAALSKETAIMLLLVLAAYHLLFGEGSYSKRYFWMLGLAVGVFVVFAVGLQAYDSLIGTGKASTFLGQIEFILSYGGSLTVSPSSQFCLFAKQTTSTITGCGWIDSVLKTPITPLNWVTYYSPVGYLITNVKVTSAATSFTYVSAGYYGITDQFEVWLVYLWGAYTVYLWRKTMKEPFTSEPEAREFKLARLALLWFLVVFFAYLALFFYGRVTYPYYFISAVPGIAIGGAWFLSRRWFPASIAYIVLAGVLLWFFLFYPDKSFLPVQLRVFIGR